MSGKVRVDDYQIDVLCGGSQKAVSAPPGLTFVTISDIYGLREAFENIKNDTKMLSRHARIGNACRQALIHSGLKLHLESGFSNTVIVFDVPLKCSLKESFCGVL